MGSKLRVVVSMPEGEHALGKTHMFGLSPGPQNLVFWGACSIIIRPRKQKYELMFPMKWGVFYYGAAF